METIGAATAGDIPSLVELLAHLFAREADFRPDRARQERGLRLILDSPGVGLVFAASDGGAAVGMASLLFTVSTAEGGPACWLEDVVVRPDRRGGGSRLLRHAVDYARAHGFARLTLLTDRDNEGAVCFYERHGIRRSAMTRLRLSLQADGEYDERPG